MIVQHFYSKDKDRTARATRIARMRVYRAQAERTVDSDYWQGVKDALAAVRAVDRDEPVRLAKLPQRDVDYFAVPSKVRELKLFVPDGA